MDRDREAGRLGGREGEKGRGEKGEKEKGKRGKEKERGRKKTALKFLSIQ